MDDLDAYLSRLGLGERPSLAELHRAHVSSIPFENLQSHGGEPVSLAGEDLERKLVAARRGGYCFEHNLLFARALQELGFDVELMLARVRWAAPPGTVRPRGHLLLRVTGEGGVWHADVGFGAGTLLEPIPFGPGQEHDQEGWRFRVVQDGEELVLQSFVDGAWSDLYGFVPKPVPLVDLETSNWFTCSHPASPFVTGLLIASQSAEGTRTTLSDWGELTLVEHTPSERTVTEVSREEIPALLAGRFGLEGFTLDPAGRVVRAAG
ncbi:MAG TPA: arylamine N-acetyltransferase [Solirubrobacteraceae bacterium]|nr:arylamine N-acetyltransferase [Solirubrobacteraceae bacterium]